MTEKEKKKKVNRPVVVRDDEYTFLCEWEECKNVLSTVKDFLLHIAAHIVQYSASKDELENANCYSCKWCECGCQILGNYGDFERHVYFHAFHVKLKCFGELLMTKSNAQPCLMDCHSRNWIPELPESLQCGWKECGVILDNPVLFYGHVNQHVDGFPDGNEVVGGCLCAWEGCDSQFKNKYKLREHIRSHTQEKVVACPTCGGLFSNRTKLFDHLKRQKETSLHCYQCSHCNKRFATERLLRDHMRHHVNHYKCPFCDMTCPAPSSLRSHIKYRHTEDKPFSCAHCERRCKSSADLRRHMESHSGQPAYSCHIEGCTFEARNYWTIANHMKKIHEVGNARKYCCHLCQKKFTRGYLLSKHLKKKHKFKWPSGHSRFRYKLHSDGLWRLQTIRYESIEVTEQILNSDNQQHVVMETDSRQSSHLEESLNSEMNMAVSGENSMFVDDGASSNQFNPSCNLEMLGDVALNGQSLMGPVISISESTLMKSTSNITVTDFEGPL
ncbi:histone H4 transcription factor-like [Gigantopelta aegis]|uniref:histone H4 transcription factor-like n=1 Tax=Gigantopelta aegis TaxID=1735272 RepID=UPI001B8892BC|nr:histone H4 transcription factor-like [Gigantopelta aegis]XP_041358294.1 histone H4 transcription factor-like [Gigantopelta aegis]